MVFSGMVFLGVFFPVFLLLYWLLPQAGKNLWLLLASLFFYAWGEPVYVLIMLFSIVVDYTNGRMIGYFDAKGKHDTVGRAFLIASIVINIGLLCFFKYANFFIDSLNALFGTGLGNLAVSLPIGISFYTFQTLSYTIDVYRGIVRPQKNPLDFGMFVTMFPQLIAGPIVRYADVEKRLRAEDRQCTPADVFRGLERFILGLGKKVLFANLAGGLFSELSNYTESDRSVALVWLAVLFYSFQIYFDFSGYSDMAIGMGQMMGFQFPENFDHPYESRSITEFWRRWHMTLGSWFREYVYIPLGGNRKGPLRQAGNLFLVWFLTGLWHGAGWNFVLWGLYYFVLLFLEKLFLKDAVAKLPSILKRVYTLFFVALGWGIFVCDDPSRPLSWLGGLFGIGIDRSAGAFGGMFGYSICSHLPFLLLLAVASTSLPARLGGRLLQMIQEIQKNESATIYTLKAGYLLVVLCLSLISIISGSYNPFLYFRF